MTSTTADHAPALEVFAEVLHSTIEAVSPSWSDANNWAALSESDKEFYRTVAERLLGYETEYRRALAENLVNTKPRREP
jgi:hypothetical protein